MMLWFSMTSVGLTANVYTRTCGGRGNPSFSVSVTGCTSVFAQPARPITYAMITNVENDLCCIILPPPNPSDGLIVFLCYVVEGMMIYTGYIFLIRKVERACVCGSR